MAIVDTLELVFNFSRGDDGYTSTKESFDPADSSLKTTVEDHKDESLDELNDKIVDGDDEWESDDWEVIGYDSDWANPNGFTDLDEYGVYAENVEEYGEAFHLRREDLGDITSSDFENSYQGCWKDAKDFVQNMIEGHHDIPSHWVQYIDWEKYARDVVMDYSEYDGADGIHIFRD